MKSKHADIYYDVIQKNPKDSILFLKHINTIENCVDALTKIRAYTTLQPF